MLRRAFLITAGLACASPFLQAQTPAPAPLRLYLARHGESTANAAKAIAGSMDVALTERGRQQARDLAQTFKGIPLDAVYSSTLSRSRVTAEIAAGGREVHALAELNERNFGRFEGKAADDPEYLRRTLSDTDDMDGGESRIALLARARLALTRIQREHPSGTVLVVAHSAMNRMVLRALLDLTTEQVNTINQDNDEVYALDIVVGQPPRLWKLIRAKNLGDL